MSNKNQTEVLIDGKIYRLCGYESEEYLQRVASYINGKIADVKKTEGYGRLSRELRGIMLDLNVADDYFVVKKKADEYEGQISAKDREIYDVKHELVSVQIELESAQKQVADLKTQLEEAKRSIYRLEASGKEGTPATKEDALQKENERK